jgi:hypothetical protein
MNKQGPRCVATLHGAALTLAAARHLPANTAQVSKSGSIDDSETVYFHHFYLRLDRRNNIPPQRSAQLGRLEMAPRRAVERVRERLSFAGWAMRRRWISPSPHP